jgi:hypothetical protein
MTTKRAKSLTKGKAKASRARKPTRAKSRRAKASRRTAARDFDSFVDAAAHALDLKLEPSGPVLPWLVGTNFDHRIDDLAPD